MFKKSDKSSKAPKTWSASGRSGRTTIPSSRSKTASPKMTGKAGRTADRKLGGKIQLVGDDLFVTNIELLQKGIDEASRIPF